MNFRTTFRHRPWFTWGHVFGQFNHSHIVDWLRPSKGWPENWKAIAALLFSHRDIVKKKRESTNKKLIKNGCLYAVGCKGCKKPGMIVKWILNTPFYKMLIIINHAISPIEVKKKKSEE